MEKLIKAIHGCRPWLEKFNRLDYALYFDKYKALCESSFTEAVASADSLEDLAASLIEAVANACRREHFFSRGGAIADDKMVLTVYVSPMLLASDNTLCHEFALKLADAWNARFPRDCYKAADFNTINSGFNNRIMGFDFIKA